MADDFFGIQRDNLIEKSGVRKVFTPHQPIQEIDLLFGRSDEVSAMVQALRTPGLHAVVYGQRGVGKSSLANVSVKLLLKHLTQRHFVKRCDHSDSFESILKEPLRDLGFTPQMKERTETVSKTDSGKVGIPLIGEVNTAGGTTSVAKYEYSGPSFSPSVVAGFLKDKKGLLLIDEADAVRNDSQKHALAELVKLLSDEGSEFKIIIVGIADTCDALFAGHQSVQRCLKEIKLTSMRDESIREIITGGIPKISGRIQFEPDVIAKIVAMSHGYPYYTHLLALKCAEEVIGDKKASATMEVLRAACGRAAKDAEATLSKVFHACTDSANTTMFTTISKAAASIGTERFTAKQLRNATERITGQKLTPVSLNNYLARIAADDESKVLKRIQKGLYRFSDPRMPSFVEIVTFQQ